MLPGGVPGCWQPAIGALDRAVASPPTTIGRVVGVVTVGLATMLMIMNTTRVTTAMPTTIAAGRMLVVVVRGGFGGSLTRSNQSGRWVLGRGPDATGRRW